MLELKEIKKSYLVGGKRQQVLMGIDIKFRDNEFTSILGSSGCGKTTLLNIIGGLDKYDSGDLIIDGVSTENYNDRNWDSFRNHRVGFIFQSYNLIMHQSVLNNVELALTLSGVSKSERKKKALAALEKVGLKDEATKLPNQLSGGQMQRVAIARALVNNPEIILADEPTGALDSKTSIQIMDLLKEIAKDKLVIMVTHNPEIAKKYSTRIIELKDGLIVNDSNPCKAKEKKEGSAKISKTSMSLKSALALSFNNLLTKKGRTFLTSFAGSIGIIGIALILSLSNGVNNYAKSLEKDSLSDFPLTLERTSYDLFGSISKMIEDSDKKEDCEKGKICSKDDIVKESVISTDKGLIQKNNLVEFKKYIESNKEFEENADNIIYNYKFDLQVYTNDYLKVNPSNVVNNGEDKVIFTEMLDKKDKFKVLAGKLPENYDEIVLVVGKDNVINDSILYSLGIKDRKNLTSDLQEIRKNEKFSVKKSTYSYEDILNREYKVILNTDNYVEENDTYVDYSNNLDYMRDVIDNGTTIRIVGIVQEKDASSSYVGYNHELAMHIIDRISETDIYQKQISDKNVNALTNTEFDGLLDTYEDLQEKLAVYEIEDPSSISIYPKDYAAKEKIVNLIEKYNEKNKDNEELVVTYSDVMKSIVGGVTKVINIVSYILVAFVAISLIVSSIMIAIITYISVLERTKEIGILRAIGASKKDIKRVFTAETIIEGLIAGVLGIAIAFILSSLVNVIVGVVADINNIASMPIGAAIFLIALSVLLNVIAGSKPASMAAKKDPVEALRTE